MTTPIGSATTPTNTNSSSGASGNGTTANGALGFTQNFNTFLTLLTTQLQNQDPLNPMDSNTFTQQLVEFSQVEQQIKTNSELSTMITNQTASETMSALPLVGQEIQYNGNQVALENGSATFSYTLPSNSASTSIIIQDANGNTVYSTTGNTTAGTYAFTWNGENNDGVQQANGGVYTVTVQAESSTNQSITTTTTAVGTVTGVNVQNNVATFDVSGVEVPMNELVNIIGTPSSSSSNSN